MFIIFAIGSINRSNEKREQERLESIAAEESLAAQRVLYEQEAAQLMVEADALAKVYDYEGAIATLDKFTGNIYDFNDLLSRRDGYVQAMDSLVAWNDPGQIVNLGFHLLIADGKKAFSDDIYSSTYRWNFITTKEFSGILAELYDNGYVLVSLDDIVQMTVNTDGSISYSAGTVYLPEGKKPIMISQTQVNYFTYMTDGNDDGLPDKNGDGFASRLVLDRNGKLTCEMVNSSGDTVTGAYDLVPILEEFIASHPDFSYKGARATLAVCGYDGLFGYRTDPETATKIGEDFYQEQLAQVPAVIQALKDAGYILACNTYDNIAYGTKELADIQEDLVSWKNEVTPIMGQLNILAYAKNSDIAAHDEPYEGEKFDALKNAGFSFFMGFCDEGQQSWIEIHDTYVRQGRLMVLGSNLKNNGSMFEGIFDADEVIDGNR